jgi:hypothetical protein
VPRLNPSRHLLAVVIAEAWRAQIPAGHELYVADNGIIWLDELPMGVHTFVDFSGLDSGTAKARVLAADKLMADALAAHLAAVQNGVSPCPD